MNKFLMLLLLAAYVAAAPSESDTQNSVNCFNTDNKFSCYFVKVIGKLKKETLKDWDVIDGVITFKRNEDIPITAEQDRSSKSLQQSEVEIMKELPHDMSKRVIKLLSMAYDASSSFLNSHTLSLKLSRQSMSRALEEGRAKLKKYVPAIASLLGIKFSVFISLVIAVISTLVVKSYIVGIIALSSAASIAYDKFFNNTKMPSDSNINQNTTPNLYGFATENGIVYPEHQYAGYRSLDDADAKIDGHNLAYSAHAPVPNATE